MSQHAAEASTKFPTQLIQVAPLKPGEYRDLFLRHSASGNNDLGMAALYAAPLTALALQSEPVSRFILDAWNKFQPLSTTIDTGSADLTVWGFGLALGEVILDRVGSAIIKKDHAKHKLQSTAIAENTRQFGRGIDSLIEDTLKAEHVGSDEIRRRENTLLSEYSQSDELPDKIRPLNEVAYRDFWLRYLAAGKHDLVKASQFALPLAFLTTHAAQLAQFASGTLESFGVHANVAQSEMGVYALAFLVAAGAIKKGISGISKIQHGRNKLSDSAIAENNAVLTAALTPKKVED